MIGLADVIKRRMMNVVLWQVLCGLAVIGGFVAVQITVATMMHPIRFVALNSRDTFYLTAGGTFETIEKIHLDYARMAAETIFDRSPEGLDNEERAERLFNTRTLAQLKADVSRDADVFKQQQIHQKFEVGRVREVTLDNNAAALEVQGQVIRTGFLNQRVADTKPVIFYVKLVSNDEIESNHKFPFVVFSYEIRFL